MSKQPRFLIKGSDIPRTKEEIKRDIILIQSQSIETALPEWLNLVLPKVAKKTGLLRATIRSSLFLQLRRQINKDRIVLELSKIRLNTIAKYAGSHWGVGPQGQRKYAFPWTPGTEPYQPIEMMQFLVRIYLIKLRNNLQRGQYL